MPTTGDGKDNPPTAHGRVDRQDTQTATARYTHGGIHTPPGIRSIKPARAMYLVRTYRMYNAMITEPLGTMKDRKSSINSMNIIVPNVRVCEFKPREGASLKNRGNRQKGLRQHTTLARRA